MQLNIKMLGVSLLCCAMGAVAQTITGSEFTIAPSDRFTDAPNSMSNYGLTRGDYSNGTTGPSAMPSGFGGINLYTAGTRRFTITNSGNVGVGMASAGARGWK